MPALVFGYSAKIIFCILNHYSKLSTAQYIKMKCCSENNFCISKILFVSDTIFPIIKCLKAFKVLLYLIPECCLGQIHFYLTSSLQNEYLNKNVNSVKLLLFLKLNKCLIFTFLLKTFRVFILRFSEAFVVTSSLSSYMNLTAGNPLKTITELLILNYLKVFSQQLLNLDLSHVLRQKNGKGEAFNDDNFVKLSSRPCCDCYA